MEKERLVHGDYCIAAEQLGITKRYMTALVHGKRGVGNTDKQVAVKSALEFRAAQNDQFKEYCQQMAMEIRGKKKQF
jgi:hypothetical protein